ncbi:MAG: MerC domain-containing protein [Pseudomonadota bacterium]
MTTSTTSDSSEQQLGVAKADLLAAALSIACIIHCLALPLAVSLLALSVPFAENEMVHRALVALAAPATLWVIHKSLSRPGQRLFIAAAVSGLVLLIAGSFLPPFERFEEPLTVTGAFILASAHLWHWFTIRAVRGPSLPA